jgi:succinate dehydrogenase / fumarate reductase membrane anchor subunit
MSAAGTGNAAKFRTPLKRARGLGAAKEGLHHFIVQRLTAVALVPLTLWIVWLALRVLHADYAQARALVHDPINATLLLAFVLAVFWHAQLGIQVVLEDYVHTRWLELTAQVLVKFFCVLGALASAFAIVRIALS